MRFSGGNQCKSSEIKKYFKKIARNKGGDESMPRKPKRLYSYPGCPKLTDARFCEEHQRIENQRYEKYGRDPAAKRRYGRAWKRIRGRYMNAHPLCERCQREDRLVKAEQVHHIKPLAECGDHSENNLKS